MTKKRKQKLEATLARMNELEQRLLSQGKRLSQTFYAMKNDVLEQLAA